MIQQVVAPLPAHLRAVKGTSVLRDLGTAPNACETQALRASHLRDVAGVSLVPAAVQAAGVSTTTATVHAITTLLVVAAAHVVVTRPVASTVRVVGAVMAVVAVVAQAHSKPKSAVHSRCRPQYKSSLHELVESTPKPKSSLQFLHSARLQSSTTCGSGKKPNSSTRL
ncbi:hypothetical protein PInf_022831 [Phytophthora infestans]|nr:hypothetical protein PInf_022831 [Phytophthora infestans]